MQPVPNGHLDAHAAPVVTLSFVELVRVRLHERSGDDGVIELPVGWVVEPGDLLASEDGRLVRVARVILCEPGSGIAALVEVASAVVGT